MLPPQLLLVPILSSIKEIAICLGLQSGQVHDMLLRNQFARLCALLSTHTVSNFYSENLLKEVAGVAATEDLLNIPTLFSVTDTVTFLLPVALPDNWVEIEHTRVTF